ncbi:hypothetical protein BD770DRAFT_382981 [Pilaira anomala]|nr:hypothetical protein BD770DRAFT_382981 [Pilaira anomala]
MGNSNASKLSAESATDVGGGDTEDGLHTSPNNRTPMIRKDVLPTFYRDGVPSSLQRWLESIKEKAEPSTSSPPDHLQNTANHCLRMSKPKRKRRWLPYEKKMRDEKIQNKSNKSNKSNESNDKISEEERLLIQTDIVPYPHNILPKSPRYSAANTLVKEYLTANPPPIKDMRLILKNLRDTSLSQEDRLTVEQEEFVIGLIRKILNTLHTYMTFRNKRLDRYFNKPNRRQIFHLPGLYYGDLQRLDLHAPDIGHYELFKIIRHFDKITNCTAKRKSEQLLLKTGRKPRNPVIRLCDPSDPECTEDIVTIQNREYEKKQKFPIQAPQRLLKETISSKHERIRMKERALNENNALLEKFGSPGYESDENTRLAKEIPEMAEKIISKMDYIQQNRSRNGKTTAQSNPIYSHGGHTLPHHLHPSTAPTASNLEPTEPLNLGEPIASTRIISKFEHCSLTDIASTTADATTFTTNTKPTSSMKSSHLPNTTTVNCVPVPNTAIVTNSSSPISAHTVGSQETSTALCSIESSGGEC